MGIGAALDADGDYGASVDYWGLGILTCEVFVGLLTLALTLTLTLALTLT